MENYDALFENQTTEPKEQPTQEFDREAWAEQKRNQRQKLYETIEEMADKTLADPDALSDYLNMQSRLGKTSVANIQRRNATSSGGSHILCLQGRKQRSRLLHRP